MQKVRSMTIAVDFDGTIVTHKYPEIGEEIPFATQTLSIYVYKKASALDMGYASAMAIMLMLVLLLAAIPYLRNTFRDQEA